MSTENTKNTNTAEMSPSDDQAEVTLRAIDAAAEVDPPFDTSAGEAALRAVMNILQSIPLEEVRRLYVSPQALVSLGLCYGNNYKEDRAFFEQSFKPAVFDVAAFDDMQERALAYWHLNISVRQDGDGPLKQLLAEAKPLRSRLLRAATYLWEKDARIGGLIAGICSGHAYLNQADDMGALVKLFMDNWASAEGKCDLTRADIVKAQELGARFMAAMGEAQMNALSNLKELRLKSGEYLRRGIERIQIAAELVFDGNLKRLSRYPKLSVMKQRRANGSDKEQPEDILDDAATDEPLEETVPKVQGTAQAPAQIISAVE